MQNNAIIIKNINPFYLNVINKNVFATESTTDSSTYKNIFRLEHSPDNSYSCKYEIIIRDDENTIASVLVCGTGSTTRVHDRSYILHEHSVYICIGNSIASLSIPNLDLKWFKKVDEFTVFQIFELRNSLIVHGETSISRLTFSGDLVWNKSGSDVFVTANGNANFEINDGVMYTES